MKKHILIAMAALVLMPLCASAQWYLFPGSPQKKKQQEQKQQELLKQELERIHGKDTTATVIAAEPEQQADSLIAEAVLEPEPKPQEVFILDIPEEIEVSLLLPMKSTSGRPSANFLEYYSGALMAVKDLGTTGLKINLGVFDTDESSPSEEQLANSDVIIGPVGTSGIKSLLARLPEGKFIVSPLEPKAAALADSCRLIQAPAPSEIQMDEIALWIKEECMPSDSVVVLRNEEEPLSDDSKHLLERLDESGVRYSVMQRPVVKDDATGVTRFVVLSDKDWFLCSSINAIGKLGASGKAVVLYSTAKIRSLEGVNAESPYNASTRLATNYYIDYDNPKICAFVRSYRALFNSEPTSFAFHGYDTMHYFVTMCARYGRQWYKKLPDHSERGLQADFIFDKDDEITGAVNKGIRRVVYTPDLSTFLQ